MIGIISIATSFCGMIASLGICHLILMGKRNALLHKEDGSFEKIVKVSLTSGWRIQKSLQYPKCPYVFSIKIQYGLDITTCLYGANQKI